jgi:hypothetical protein
MTTFEAKRITKKGYRFAIAGISFGFILSFTHGPEVILIWGYSLWALFHGVQIMQPIMERIYDFGPVHLRVTTISALFQKSIQLKLLRTIYLIVIGYLVGAFGGAIIRQICLWVIAYRE